MALPVLKIEEEVFMEANVARLDTNIEHIRSDISEMKAVNQRIMSKIEDVDQRLLSTIGGVDRRLSSKIEDVDRRLSSKIDDVDQRLSSKIDDVDRRLSSKIDDVKGSVISLDRRMLKLAGGLRLRLQKFEVAAAERETRLFWKLAALIFTAMGSLFGLLKWFAEAS
jgi:chromosome segregation ATPase